MVETFIKEWLVDAVFVGPLSGLADVILGTGKIPTGGRRRHEVFAVSGGQLSAGTD